MGSWKNFTVRRRSASIALAQPLEASLKNSSLYDGRASGRPVYNYFRNYDPTLGRYVESDPIGLRGGLNPYRYVCDNPVTNTDEMGLAVGGEDCEVMALLIARGATALSVRRRMVPGGGNFGHPALSLHRVGTSSRDLRYRRPRGRRGWARSNLHGVSIPGSPQWLRMCRLAGFLGAQTRRQWNRRDLTSKR